MGQNEADESNSESATPDMYVATPPPTYHSQQPSHASMRGSLGNFVDDNTYHSQQPSHASMGGSFGHFVDDNTYHPQPPPNDNVYHPQVPSYPSMGGSSFGNMVVESAHHPQETSYYPSIGTSSGVNASEVYVPDFYQSQSSMHPNYGGNISCQELTSFMAVTSINSEMCPAQAQGSNPMFTTPRPTRPLINDDTSSDEEEEEEEEEEDDDEDENDNNNDGGYNDAPQKKQRPRNAPNFYINTISLHKQKLRKK